MNRYFSSFFLLVLFVAVSAAAQTISGTVHNLTKGQPASGDDVVLLRLTENMPEEARTKTDAEGTFKLNVTSATEPHLLRVVHEGVNYDQPLTGMSPLSIAVYDAVAKVPGLTGSIGIAQLESDGRQLKVMEMYDIVNNSTPPATQARDDNYVISLPPQGAFESAQVRRGQGIWLKVTPEAIKGQPGKFAINFPIRPGETLFKFVYQLPYENAATLRLHLPYPIQKFAVMHPPTMIFKSLQPNSFKAAGVAQGLTVETAVSSPIVGNVPPFQVSGVGTAPPHGSQGTPAPSEVAPPAAAAQENPPVEPPASPAATPNQQKKELWLMVGGIIVLLVVLVFALWRTRRGDAAIPEATKSGQSGSAVDALKEQLFQLESERLGGSISAQEYAARKKALTESMEQALTKKDAEALPKL
jgi:hypothetical protein